MSNKSNNWVEEADWDLENAKILLKNERFNTVVFHSQQAAEKAVKALLYHNKINGWGHSIYTLLQSYKSLKNVDLTDLSNLALSLDKHYITTRYPDALPNIPPHKAVIKHGINGLLADLDISDFVEKLEYLLDNRQKRYHLGKNARKTIAKRYNKNVIIENYLSQYHSLIEKGK